jgi:chorismate dehydratase
MLSSPSMIRLGHIDYSNCVPVHALLLDTPQPGIELIRDVPSALNRALAAGAIDAAPCSSIEYARHAADYRILPAHAIGSAGAVQSILLESTVPLRQLGGRRVAVPTASATSVVLLRAILELRLGIRPEYSWFEQAAGPDPLTEGAAAALRIGDIALNRVVQPGRSVHDLGAEWFDWTALPFPFAVWQVRRDLDGAEMRRLISLLRTSHAYYLNDTTRVAHEHAASFGLTPARLLAYWRSLRFELDAPMQRGLLRFYRLAADLGEAPAVTTLDIVAPGHDG